VTERRDLTEASIDDLVTLATTAQEQQASARQQAKDAETLLGLVIAELSRRGRTFAQIGTLLGIDDSTAHRRAKPYL
jgi:hypothetical protein